MFSVGEFPEDGEESEEKDVVGEPKDEDHHRPRRLCHPLCHHHHHPLLHGCPASIVILILTSSIHYSIPTGKLTDYSLNKLSQLSALFFNGVALFRTLPPNREASLFGETYQVVHYAGFHSQKNQQSNLQLCRSKNCT